MLFVRITQAHPHLTRIQPWYESAFPADERRHFDELRALLSCPDMYLCSLVYETQPVGFIIYWQWDEVVFIEHFVIDPAQRGKQFGQQALASLLRIDCRHCLLEVEHPQDDTNQRRIRFYERQGFRLAPFPYVQPPYQPGKAAVSMRLMSVPALDQQQTFDQLSALIRERVYERFYSFTS